jgi:DNA polymerase-3 subunit alpha
MDGISKHGDIAKRCLKCGIDACALTDHGSISGAVDFIEVMTEHDIKPIVGCELYICEQDGSVKTSENRSLSHLVVLAKNFEGWKTLVKIISESNTNNNFYYKPRLSLEQLAKHLDGNIIGFSGHLGSHMSQCIFKDFSNLDTCKTSEDARKFINPNWVEDCTNMACKLRDMFGHENFFLEIQLVDKDNVIASKWLRDGIRYVGKKLNIPCIGTPDAHYAKKEDAHDQRVVLCNNLNTTFAEVFRKKVNQEDISLGTFFLSDNYHIPSVEEMQEVGNTQEELENTVKIADMCEVYKLTGPPMFPKFNCPDNMSSNDYLRKLCEEGMKKRKEEIQHHINNSSVTMKDYKERFLNEYEILSSIGLSDYFLIIHDIMKYAREVGQITGAGRGSAAGSLILYLLEVTEIDPIKYHLLFSRFYNKGRNTEDHVSLPDVDMDFEVKNRDKIINYIRDKYGHEQVAQMITYTKMQGRSALKDVMRVHNVCSFNEMNKITSYIPSKEEIVDHLQVMKEKMKEDGIDGEPSIIRWALENTGEKLKEWAYIDDDGNIQGPMGKIFEQAIRLEGVNRSLGKHAAGVIVAQFPLHEICPMIHDKSSDESICGFDMDTLEKMGHVKLDILGVAILDKIHEAINLITTGSLYG